MGFYKAANLQIFKTNTFRNGNAIELSLKFFLEVSYRLVELSSSKQGLKGKAPHFLRASWVGACLEGAFLIQQTLRKSHCIKCYLEILCAIESLPG